MEFLRRLISEPKSQKKEEINPDFETEVDGVSIRLFSENSRNSSTFPYAFSFELRTRHEIEADGKILGVRHIHKKWAAGVTVGAAIKAGLGSVTGEKVIFEMNKEKGE